MFWRRSEIATDVTQTGGGRVWRAVLGSGLVVGLSIFLASVIGSPSKRNLEALAGLIFLGIVLIAQPFVAYLFTLALIPFPAQTSVASTSMLLVVAMGVLVAARSRHEGLASPFVDRQQDLAIMGWVLFMALAFWNQQAEAMDIALRYAFGFGTALVLYYVTISLVDTRKRALQVLRLSQVVALVLAIIGILQWVYPDRQILPQFFSFSRMVAESGEMIRRGEVRVMATFHGVELFAEYMALSVMFQYFLLRWSRSIWSKSFWLFSLLMVIGALFASATRGGLITVAVGFTYLIIFGAKVVPRAQSGKVVFVALAVFYLGLGMLEPLVSHMMERITSIGVDDGSIQNRSVVLINAFGAIADHPWIGHGLATPLGTFRGAVSANIHNLYLTLAYTIGIPGLLVFVWILVGFWKKSREAFSLPYVSQAQRELALVLHVTLVMFMVDQIKIEYTRQPLYMHLVWVHFGMIMAVWRISRNEAEVADSRMSSGTLS